MKPKPHAFTVAEHGPVTAAHVVAVKGGFVGLLCRADVVCRCWLVLPDRNAVIQAFAAAGWSGAPVAVPAALKPVAEALTHYFAGDEVDPAAVPVAFDAGPQTEFLRAIYGALRRVKRGATVTYGELAAAAGRPKAARAVGMAMARNRFPLLVPCHRVLAGGGGLGGFSSAGGLDDKRRLLVLEGVLPATALAASPSGPPAAAATPTALRKKRARR